MYFYSDMECLHRHNFLPFQVIFCSFAPLLIPKIKFWKIYKKTFGHIILLHMVPLIQIIWCMIPEIWSSTDRIFSSSWVIFYPFSPLTPWKMKISKIKKALEISSFYTSVENKFSSNMETQNSKNFSLVPTLGALHGDSYLRKQ